MCLSCEEGADELFSQRQILSLFFNESTSVQSQLKEPWDGVLDWSIDCGLLPDKNFSDSTLEEKWIMDFHPQRTDCIRVTLLPCLTEGLKFLSQVVTNLEWDHLTWGVSLPMCGRIFLLWFQQMFRLQRKERFPGKRKKRKIFRGVENKGM